MNMETNQEPGAGFGPAPPLLPVGTEIRQDAQGMARIRNPWDNLPVLEQAVSQIVDHVKAEKREDKTIPFSALTMNETGLLSLDKQLIQVEQIGFRQLCTRAGIPGGSAYLIACPPALRSTNFNHWFSQTEGEVKLRMRTAPKIPSLYAAVSPTYAVYDAPEVLTEAMDMLPSDARVEASYDGLRLRFRAVFQADVPTASRGEVFKAGVQISTADDGTGALRIVVLLWRVVSTNLMLFNASQGGRVKRIHRGASLDMAAALFLGIREAKNSIKPVVELWNRAKKEKVVRKAAERELLLETLFARKLLQAPGVRVEESVSSILAAWDIEPGPTRADLINAVSRAAHESSWPSLAVSEGLESQAGQLLEASLTAQLKQLISTGTRGATKAPLVLFPFLSKQHKRESTRKT